MQDGKDGGDMIRLPPDEFEDLLATAATRGARQALKEIGLDNGNARDDIRELRSLLGALRLAKRTAWQTAIRLITTGFILALLAGAAVKLKLFGDSP